MSSGLAPASTLVTDFQAYDPDSPDRSQNADLVAAVAVAIWWAERWRWSEEMADGMLVERDYGWEDGRSSLTGLAWRAANLCGVGSRDSGAVGAISCY